MYRLKLNVKVNIAKAASWFDANGIPGFEGGSCETVLRDRQINPIFEGTTGRKVPTVIYFASD